MSTEKNQSHQSLPRPQTPEYHHSLRFVANAPLRSLLAFGAFSGTITTSLFCTLPLANLLDLVLIGNAPNLHQSLLRPTNLTWSPGLLAANNILMGLQIPVAMAVERYFYNQPWGSVCSVENRFRWNWLSVMAKRVVPAVAVVGGIIQFLKPAGWPVLTPRSLAMGLATLTTVPLQSAAEEFAIRGLLQRVVGSWFADSTTSFWASTALTTVFFASMHMSGDMWLNGYYALSSVCASLLTRWTGGLEASVLVHAANNVALLLPIMLADNMTALKEFASGKTLGFSLLSLAALNMLSVTWYICNLAKRQNIKSTHVDSNEDL